MARQTVKALRKNVTAKCCAAAMSVASANCWTNRKRAKAHEAGGPGGNPQSAFLAVLKARQLTGQNMDIDFPHSRHPGVWQRPYLVAGRDFPGAGRRRVVTELQASTPSGRSPAGGQAAKYQARVADATREPVGGIRQAVFPVLLVGFRAAFLSGGAVSDSVLRRWCLFLQVGTISWSIIHLAASAQPVHTRCAGIE